MEQNIKMEIPKNARKLIDALQANGEEAYLVGGCVRDTIMGNSASDIDIATSCPAPHTIDILRTAEITVVPTGLKHGTVTAILDSTPYEITTYRIDGTYSDSRHPDQVRFCTSIIDDLSRRDFTINAIAFSEQTGIVDPYNGIADIKNKIVRCVGDPNKRFSEDALRIMRALRFSAQLGFEIEIKTSASLIEHKDLLLQIANERIGREFEKLVVSKDAPYVLEKYPQVIETILQIYTRSNQWKLAVSALLALDTTNLFARLATLALGFGVDESGDANVQLNKHSNAIRSDTIRTEQLSLCVFRLKHLRFSRKVISKVFQILQAYYLNINNLCEPEIRLLMGQYGADEFLFALEIKKAYASVLYDEKNPEYIEQLAAIDKVQQIASDCLKQNKPYQISDLAISGKDLIDEGIKQGPEVGKTLQKMLELVVCGKCKNTKDELLRAYAHTQG